MSSGSNSHKIGKNENFDNLQLEIGKNENFDNLKLELASSLCFRHTFSMKVAPVRYFLVYLWFITSK